MSGQLTEAQLRALLDILIHNETYAEVQSFRKPEAIDTYGWPFVGCDASGRPVQPHQSSSSPLLQLVLTRLLLHAPAVRDLSTDFWPVKFKGIMKQLGDADLSDSYDKGTLGTRKRLATAASVIHEALSRGLLSGVSRAGWPDLQRHIDMTNAADLTRSWNECISHLVHGDLIDQIFDQFAKSADFDAHSPLLKGAVEYAELHVASFLHQAFVISADGPHLLKLIENVHRLVPYTVISQTLRLGNAATMISAISRLFLSKVGRGTISNWIRLTSSPTDGMNLMQRILLLVLDFDTTDFRKVANTIVLDQASISKEQVAAIDKHLAADPEQRELTRQKSIRERTSIIVAIFSNEEQKLVESMTEAQHALCLEYYAAKLAIRDREQIIEVLCKSTPDLTTAAVSEGIRVLDPMIRVVHKNVDLRKHLSAMQSFLSDFIKITKPSTQQGSNSKCNAPSLKDFVELLKRNRQLLWTWVHDFCSGCPELRDTWRAWMNDTIKAFRETPPEGHGPLKSNGESKTANTGDVKAQLLDAFRRLPDGERRMAYMQIDTHSHYLTRLEDLSIAKMQSIVDSVHGKDSSAAVPGVYVSRWQSLLDETLITPAQPDGPLRYGRDVKNLRATRKPDRLGTNTPDGNVTLLSGQESPGLTPPDVSVVVAALGPQFKEIVAEISRAGLPEVVERDTAE
ncbi:hypothetical protein GGR50DRAFT_663038 [Xylaria sp. CBS 124048]|nr:hypothetical protein GGR50DRAFT_663038 [Xylaria sp. CBS 124048]